MSASDFLIGAPIFLTKRFNSVSGYVWETLFPETLRNDILRKEKTKIGKRKELARLKSISDEATTIVFLFLINKFFIEGARAAKQAVDTLKELKVEGFFIGNNYFSERNEKVVQGDEISQMLISSIQDKKAKDLITKSNYISEILDEYRKIIK